MKKLMTVLMIVFLAVLPIHSFAAATTASKMGSIVSIKHSTGSAGEDIVIMLDSYGGYKTFTLSNPERIVVDFTNVAVKDGPKTIKVATKVVSQIRYAQFEKTTARVVVDLVQKKEYTVEKKDKSIIIHINNPIAEETVPGNTSGNGKETADKNGQDLASRGDDKIPETAGNSIDIACAVREGKQIISISAKDYKSYNIMRLTSSDRLVIDIKGAVAPVQEQKISVGGNLLKSVRYAQFGKDTARIVLDTVGMPQYQVEENQDYLILSLESPGYKNMIYHSNGDRVYFTLPGVKLTDGGEVLTKFYTEAYDPENNTYTVSFPSKLANLGNGVLKINDSMLDKLEISSADGTTSLRFYAKEAFSYLVFYRDKTNDTAITILRPAKQEERLVVIDAGHGGVDPGAQNSGVLEKNLNLDIAVKLNKLLKEKNIKTYMIREDDSYLALYERAYIANTLKASLFLSVHNNALEGNINYGGTMTLYNPGGSGFNSKAFAQVVQNALIGKLGTTDRKIIERPGLVVLKATNMPSVIAEIAFLTSKSDRTKLMEDAFRQKAAEALCNAIVDSLTKIK